MARRKRYYRSRRKRKRSRFRKLARRIGFRL